MQYPTIHQKALNTANTVQMKNIYGNTRLDNNNQVGGATSMENFQNVTLTNQNTLNKMKRKIVYRRDERVRQNIAFNSLY